MTVTFVAILSVNVAQVKSGFNNETVSPTVFKSI